MWFYFRTKTHSWQIVRRLPRLARGPGCRVEFRRRGLVHSLSLESQEGICRRGRLRDELQGMWTGQAKHQRPEDAHQAASSQVWKIPVCQVKKSQRISPPSYLESTIRVSLNVFHYCRSFSDF